MGREARDPPGTDRHTQTDRQTDFLPQPTPLSQRTQGPKYAARAPLTLILRCGSGVRNLKGSAPPADPNMPKI